MNIGRCTLGYKTVNHIKQFSVNNWQFAMQQSNN